jgi:hypothetical protein
MGKVEMIEEAVTLELEPPAPAQLPAVQPTGAVAAQTSRDDMLMTAMQRGFTPEQIGQMMDLRDRHEAREAEKAFNDAFAGFKAEAVRIIKNRKVDAGPLSGKKYAELFAVVNAVTPALSLHGLSASWKLTKDEKDWIEVTCTLKHALGHSESVSMGGPPDVGGAKNPIQARASTVSYLERYTLKAITGLSEQEDDDDGRGGKGNSQQQDSSEDTALIEAGRAASLEGMKPLTAWWATLTPAQRNRLDKEFGAMRKAARQAEGA